MGDQNMEKNLNMKKNTQTALIKQKKGHSGASPNPFGNSAQNWEVGAALHDLQQILPTHQHPLHWQCPPNDPQGIGIEADMCVMHLWIYPPSTGPHQP